MEKVLCPTEADQALKTLYSEQFPWNWNLKPKLSMATNWISICVLTQETRRERRKRQSPWDINCSKAVAPSLRGGLMARSPRCSAAASGIQCKHTLSQRYIWQSHDVALVGFDSNDSVPAAQKKECQLRMYAQSRATCTSCRSKSTMTFSTVYIQQTIKILTRKGFEVTVICLLLRVS